jgi:hypothetical protein
MSGAMRGFLCLALAVATYGPAVSAWAGETIIFIRHGEKPEAGLGQLDCRGLNRALKLPAVIGAMFGKPDAILAPNPAKRKKDNGVLYDYVRPLATVAPTAIAFGLPINTRIGFDDTSGLLAELRKSEYREKTVLVAWEHKIINEAECVLLTGSGCDFKKDGKDVKKSGEVVKWQSDDFDRIDVVRITVSGKRATVESKAQGLNFQPETCPR